MTSSTTPKSTIARRVAVATTALGAGLAVAVLTAPTAAAGVTNVSISPGLSFGSSTQYGTGCTYEITAAANNPNEQVYFYDDRGWTGGWHPVNGGVARVNYTPTQTGAITITAYQWNPFDQKTVSINVGNGINLGSSCVVL